MKKESKYYVERLAEKHEQKMKQIKLIINTITEEIGKHIPTVTNPITPTGKMTKDLFWYLNQIKELNKDRYDKNFPVFLETLEKVLLYLGELDDHYRMYIVFAFLAIHDLVEKSKKGKDTKEWIQYMRHSTTLKWKK